MGNDLPEPWWMRMEAVAGYDRSEAGGRRVQLTDQFCRAAQGQTGPGIGREAVPMARAGLPDNTGQANAR